MNINGKLNVPMIAYRSAKLLFAVARTSCPRTFGWAIWRSAMAAVLADK
jgi:hypothetical protein